MLQAAHVSYHLMHPCLSSPIDENTERNPAAALISSAEYDWHSFLSSVMASSADRAVRATEALKALHSINIWITITEFIFFQPSAKM